MRFRTGRLIAAALLMASTGLAGAEPVGFADSVIEDDLFSADSYVVQGFFNDGSREALDRWQPLNARFENCAKGLDEDRIAALKKLGYDARGYRQWAYVPYDCYKYNIYKSVFENYPNRRDFASSMARVEPVYRTYIYALANGSAAVTDTANGERLSAATVFPDQMLRQAMSWGQGQNGALAPALPPRERETLQALLWLTIERYDDRNNALLTKAFDDPGFGRAFAADKEFRDVSWLIAQHATNDPVLQARFLNFMEAFLKEHPDSDAKSNFALLYDRVTLALTGRQRYGTQFACKDGRMQVSPLEDPARVEAWRAGVGLDTLAENVKRIETRDGTACVSF